MMCCSPNQTGSTRWDVASSMMGDGWESLVALMSFPANLVVLVHDLLMESNA
jgi:hypothetical protein